MSKMIDIVEDIGKGIVMEQLAPKPATGGKTDERTSGSENEENRK